MSLTEREKEVESRARIHSCRQQKRYDSSWKRDRLQGERWRRRRRCRDGGGRETERNGGGALGKEAPLNWFQELICTR